MKNLEILIPTYNRAEHLGRTLFALKQSPFRDCKITVLDNCSPSEDTAETVSRYRYDKGLPNLKYICNEYNVGGSMNYCRALTEAKATYVWILGDDDQYSWEYGLKWDEKMIEVIEEGFVDAILPGTTLDNFNEMAGDWKVSDLRKAGHPFFFPLSFAPAVIFKRRLYTDNIIAQAHIWSINGSLLPMIPFVNLMVAQDFRLYVASQRHISKGLRHHYSSVQALVHWVSASRRILYYKDMYNELLRPSHFIQTVTACILCDPDSEGRVTMFKELCKLVPMARLFWPLVLLPARVRRTMRKGLGLSEPENIG